MYYIPNELTIVHIKTVLKSTSLNYRLSCTKSNEFKARDPDFQLLLLKQYVLILPLYD